MNMTATAMTADPELATAPQRGRLRAALSYRNISAVYLLLAIIVIFGILVPQAFLTPTNLKLVLSATAVTGLVALGLVLALAGGVYDMSIGGSLGFAGIVCTFLQAYAGWSIPLSIVAGVAAGVLVGVVNAFLVVRLRIDSFIATLGTGSILGGLVLLVSGGQQITGLDPAFQSFGRTEFLGLPLPVFYLLLLALLLWYVMSHRPAGRYLYATGGGRESARLAGVRTDRYVAGALIACATIAAFAGVVAVSRIGVGAIDIGPKYVLPAFAAAFFGSTQFARGRFNVWGTWLAVVVLGAGVSGLELVQAGSWATDVFNGVVLILAVALAVGERRRSARVRR